jgi:hypothetical protein
VRPRIAGSRLPTSELLKAARRAARKVLGKGDWIAAVVDPYLYLSDAAKALKARRLARLQKAVDQALSQVPGVAQVFDTKAMPSQCPPIKDESLPALVCRSVQSGRGGDVYVALKPGYFFDVGGGKQCGTSHGNAAIYDRSVPLLVRAPGRVQAGEVVQVPQSFELFSRQLDALLSLH